MYVSFVRQAYITWAPNSWNVPGWFFKVTFPIESPIISATYLHFFLLLYLCILLREADTYSPGPGCCRVILWPDSLIRSGSCWHERWEPPWAVVHPTFVEEERRNLCGQAETYRANASAVLLSWSARGAQLFFILARRLVVAGEQPVSVPCLAPDWLLCQ